MTTVYLDAQKQQVIKACVKENKPVLLIVETGTGKTTIIREEAIALKKELIRVSLNGATSIEEIVGKWLAKDGSTYWMDGVLTTAMKKGHWIVFDEINAALPEVLFVLHSLLDDDRCIRLVEKDDEKVVPHKEFRFFATMNPTEEYAGTKEMNKALMSRFTAVIHVNVPDAETEMKILKDKGADAKDAQDLVQLAERLRDRKKDEQIYYFCSTRDLIHAVELKSGGLSLKDATSFAIFGKMTSMELQVVKDLSTLSFVAGKTIDELLEEATRLNEDVKGVVAENTKLKDDLAKLQKENTAQAKRIKELGDQIGSKEDIKKLLKQVIGGK